MLKRIVFIMAFFVLMAGASFSADGDFDSTFDGDGVAVYDGNSTATMGYAVALQQDRKIVVTGSIAGKLSIFRYNNDGTLDNTFDGDGIATYGGYGFGYGVDIQPDGKIVIVGESDWDAVILRYNGNGTLDTSFGGGDGIVTYDIGTDDIAFFAVALQTDGKIVVAGYADYPEYKTLILRYNSDGTMDNTFGSDGVVTYQNNYYENGHDCGVAIQSDGKIVVATGYAFGSYNSDILVLRYNSDGTPDVTFNGNGVIRYDGLVAETDYGHAVVIQPNGKIVVVGETYNGTNFDVIILRYNNDGTLDSTFSGDGIATYDSGNYDYGRAVAVQANGKIVVVGSNYNPYTNEGNILILRYDGNGILDNTFGNYGVVKYNSGITDYYDATSVVEQPDGKIVVSGGIWNYGDVLTLRLTGQSVNQSVNLLLPNGGDVIPSGGIYGICWEAPSNAVKFDLSYSTNNETGWNFIKSITGLHCTHWKEVPVVTANKKKCRVKVIGYDSNGTSVGEGISDKPFTIEVLRVTSPNGGETFTSGDTSIIQWTTHKTIKPVAKTVLKYSTDGSTWKKIKTLIGNPGSYSWTVPSVSSTKCKVEVILKDASGANIGMDVSDKFFTIQKLYSCVLNSDCVEGEFCKKPVGQCGGGGVCTIRGDYCIQIADPVCGCDGVTYSNSYCAYVAGVSVAYSGTCIP